MLTIPYLKMIEHGHYHLFWMDLLWKAPMYKVMCNGKENRNVHCSVWRSCHPSAWWPGLKNWIVELTYNTAVDVWCITYDATHFLNLLISSVSGWLMLPSPVQLIFRSDQIPVDFFGIHIGQWKFLTKSLNIIFSSVYGLGILHLKSYLTLQRLRRQDWASPYQENREPLRAECVLAVKRWGDLSKIRSSFQWACGPPYW